MVNIKVLKAPGFLLDLNFLFYLKFNPQHYTENIVDKKKTEEYEKYRKDILQHFGDIPDSLYIFYKVIDSDRCFMTANYIDPYREEFPLGFDFKDFMDKLLDTDRLIENMIHFYLYDFPKDERMECVASSAKLFSCIKASRYQGNDKSMLYEFFLDPTPYIETLRYTLMEKELLLSCFHKENYDKILEAHNNTTYEILCEPIKETRSLKFFNDSKTFYTSYCLLNKCCMKFSFILDGVLYFLGCDYATILEELKNRDLEEPSLEALCFALGEESRMRIAEVLLAKGEATCKDVEMEFQFSGSTAYHHLSILVRAGVVKIRTAGKTIYYSINKEHFKVMGKALKKFSDS